MSRTAYATTGWSILDSRHLGSRSQRQLRVHWGVRPALDAQLMLELIPDLAVSRALAYRWVCPFNARRNSNAIMERSEVGGSRDDIAERATR